MSTFSELLARYIKNSGLSIKYLSETTDIDNTLLIRFKNGSRFPHNRNQIGKIMDSLCLSTEDRSLLMRQWEITLIGEGTYSHFLSIKDMVESIGNNPSIQAKVQPNVPEAPHRENSVILKSTTDIRIAINDIFLEAATQNSLIRIQSSRCSETLQDCIRLLLSMPDMNNISVVEILQLLPANPDPEYQNENIRRIGMIYPLIAKYPNYRALYIYANDPPVNSVFSFTNTILTQNHLLLISGDWNDGVLISNSQSLISHYQQKFDLQADSCKTFGTRYDSLLHEMDYVNDTLVNSSPKVLIGIAWQPCMPFFASPEDFAQLKIPGGSLSEETIRRFFGGYLAVLHSMPSFINIFTEDGLTDFIQTGELSELPKGALIPLPFGIRIRALRQILAAAEDGTYTPLILRKECLDISKPFTLMSFDRSNSVWLNLVDDNVGDVNFLLNELGVATALNEFIHFLTTSDLWVYSKEESLQIIRKHLDLCEKAPDNPDNG